MDRGLRRFGLSGKSIIPLISGTACAIPAIMSTRNIESWKERNYYQLLHLPHAVCYQYAILIALVIPDGYFLGFSYKGLMLMFLYLIGFHGTRNCLDPNYYLINSFKSYFVIELPNYKIPLIKNVALTVWEKTKSFVMSWKIILAISILLWILASYGPGENFNQAENIIQKKYPELAEKEIELKTNSFKLENSYVGVLGRSIEPIIILLSYDWKIGIAIITLCCKRSFCGNTRNYI